MKVILTTPRQCVICELVIAAGETAIVPDMTIAGLKHARHEKCG
jgi:hypothetical protein